MNAKKIDSLTSLRFFAAAMIVVGHGDRLFGSPAFIRNIASAQAVSFFFTLSGFILAHTYHDRLLDGRSLQRYFVARITRIWPLHLVTAAATFCLISGVQAPLTMAMVNIFLLQSWVPSMPWFFSLNGVAWSISTEAFFYLLFPLLINRIESTWHWKTLLACALALTSIAITACISDNVAFWGAYIFPISRLPEFMIGIAAYYYFYSHDRQVTRTRATIVETAMVLVVFGEMWLSHISASFIHSSQPRLVSIADWLDSGAGSPAFALLILVFARENGVLSRGLRNRVWVILGEASFALYMCHQIIGRMMWDRYTLVKSFPNGLMWSIYIICAVLLSIALHYFIEKPMRKLIMKQFDDRFYTNEPPAQARVG
ncbi:acyltransferase family protein [Paraburkholderia dipogonis]|uniref:acyltransferase family protein n=1 Tax=Paraburkholderia dipogonis TaxID=1211383 RepID=UPI0038BCAF37